MARKVFLHGGNGQKIVFALWKCQEKCFGMAGMDRAGALGHPRRECLGVLGESVRVARFGALGQPGREC